MQSVAAALSVLACLAAPAAAQNDTAVFRSDSRLVVLHATVLDAHGELVTNLPQSAFHIFENGVEQQLKIFRREDAPVSIGLIIDDSGSMTNKRRKVGAAALALIKASHPEDEVFVLHFNERSYLDTDFTNDTKRLEAGLGTFDTQGATAMRDAIRLAIEHMEQKAREDKKVLLVVSDGEDNLSAVDRGYVVKAAQQSGVLVYAMGFLNEEQPESAEKAKKELDGLARATGGEAFFLNDVSEAERTTRAIAHDIRNQYTLAYSPAREQLDGTYRRIRVVADAPVPLTVRTRAGYYAMPETSAQALTEPGR